ncbi:MAG TPA: hypothetical protein VMJ10_06980 [Kofleriaceae bacterium]|nr:hypothetical protein [Kofleriaceae bacterium]
MRVAAALLVLAASSAHADRSTVMALGLTGDARATGASYSAAGDSNDLAKLGGARLTLTFESDPLAIPPPGGLAADTRLVPELFTGFLADDVHAEGFVGAGLRAEAQLASHRHARAMRTGMYVAGRGLVIGGHQDAAAEFVLGEYLDLARGRRFGWEGGAMMRPRSDQSTDRSHELDTIVTIYYGWR